MRHLPLFFFFLATFSWAQQTNNIDLNSDRPSEKTLSGKLFLRYSAGLLSNEGTIKGSTLSFGGGGLGYTHFILEQVAVGAAYKVETDYTTIPLYGYDLFTRYYYLGPGTVVRNSSTAGDQIEHVRAWNPYVSGEFSSRQFYSPNSTSTAIVASLLNFNCGLGLDYNIGRHYDISTEFNTVILPFSGSDPRVRIRWFLLNLGLNYIF